MCLLFNFLFCVLLLLDGCIEQAFGILAAHLSLLLLLLLTLLLLVLLVFLLLLRLILLILLISRLLLLLLLLFWRILLRLLFQHLLAEGKIVSGLIVGRIASQTLLVCFNGLFVLLIVLEDDSQIMV